MNLNLFERLVTNSPLRAFEQKVIEGPLLKGMASREAYPLSLEIGCGRGAGAVIILEQFHAEKVIATDADPAQIERARAWLGPEFRDRVEFKVADAMALDEPDGKYDAVFSFGVLHHMEDWQKAVSEVARVLKPGGEVFFVEFLRPFLRSVVLRNLASHPPGGMFTFEELRDGFASCGIGITGSRRVGSLLVFGAGMKRDATPT